MAGYAAFITGSSRGIGKGIALALAAEGFSICVNAPVQEPEIDDTVSELRSCGAKVVAAIGDVGELATHSRMLDEAEAALGPITTLVNNAGVSVLRRGDLLDVTAESYDRCQTINTRGCFFLTQAWARRVLARDFPTDLHHSIITISSVNANAASVNRGEYCVSKAGTSMIAKLFAARLGEENIGSYEIQPGVIETGMTFPVRETYLRRIAEGLTVAQRMGQPSDIGSVTVALATGKMAYCVGQVLRVDGGLLISRF